MTSLSYDKIFENFLGNVTDPIFASLPISDVYEIAKEYLHKVMAQSYIRRIFSKVEMDDVIMQFNYEMSHPTDGYSDEDFVIYILSKGMVIEWLQPQVKSKANIAQMFTGKEARFFSQSAHISELRGMLDDTRLEVRKAIRDRGYIFNSYLEDK